VLLREFFKATRNTFRVTRYLSRCCALVYFAFNVLSLTLRSVVGQRKGTNFTTALYCHCIGKRNVMGHLTIRLTIYGISFLYCKQPSISHHYWCVMC